MDGSCSFESGVCSTTTASQCSVEIFFHRVVLGKDTASFRETLFKDLGQRVRSIHEGPDGFIYFTTDNPAGRLMRIEPAG